LTGPRQDPRRRQRRTAQPLEHHGLHPPHVQPAGRQGPEGLATKVAANHWAVRGEAEIDDWYDANGQWQALRGKLDDGSMMEYRRI
jgi:hypothetical protein